MTGGEKILARSSSSLAWISVRLIGVEQPGILHLADRFSSKAVTVFSVSSF